MYQVTGSKELASGVRVREMTRLTYDPQDALAWAIEHRLALILDSKTFDQLARVTALPFVTYWREPQATLSPCFPGQPASTHCPLECAAEHTRLQRYGANTATGVLKVQ